MERAAPSVTTDPTDQLGAPLGAATSCEWMPTSGIQLGVNRRSATITWQIIQPNITQVSTTNNGDQQC